MVDTNFTNGMIAVKEKSLLGEKLLRLAEGSLEEALRALKESGFGSGAEGADGEALILSEESALDAFIRAYAPGRPELVYLLAPRDFHNAKALCKAKLTGAETDGMLAPEGERTVAELNTAIESGDFDALGKALGGAVKEVLEKEGVTGAEIGTVFDRALFSYLFSVSKRAPLLKKFLKDRADRTNILTALRASGPEQAEALFVEGGTLSEAKLSRIFTDKAEAALDGTPYADFYKLCLAAREKGLPFTEAERSLDSCEAEYFAARRFALEGKQPFLYYVFRRRAEIANVRILLVCLNAGLPAQDIKKRLRAVNA